MPNQTVTFPETNSSAEQSQILNIPNLQQATIVSKTPADSTVRLTIGVDTLTVYAGGGTPTRSVSNATKFSTVGLDSRSSSSNSFPTTIPYSDAQGYAGNIGKSGTATVTSGTFTPSDTRFGADSRFSTTNTFPTTVYYSVNGYVGDIGKNGASYVISGSAGTPGSPADTKFVSTTRSYTVTWNWIGSGGVWTQNGSTNNSASSINYNSGGYINTSLPRTFSDNGARTPSSLAGSPANGATTTTTSSGTATYSGNATKPAVNPTPDTRNWQQDYGGNVTKPSTDTRIWKQNYSGLVYKAGNDDFWTYSVTVSYAGNTAPTATVTSPKDDVGSLYTKRPAINFLPSDTDTGQTITDFRVQYSNTAEFTSIVLDQTRSIDSAGFSTVPVTSGATCSYNPINDLPYGTYYVRVAVYDGTEWGVFSTGLKFTTVNPNWSNPGIGDNDFGFRTIWVSELRTKINEARIARGLSAFTFGDTTLTTNVTNPRKTHIDELRAAMSDFGTFSWTDPIITVNVTPRRGLHIKEIRSYLENV